MKKILLAAWFVFSGIQCCAQNAVMQAFKQGPSDGEGNCASVAVIKAAIGKYGPGKVFTVIHDRANQCCTIILKTGVRFCFTYSELEAAQKANGFIQKRFDPVSTDIKAYADTCFAVICKAYQQKSFADAIRTVNDGISAESAASALGFRPIEVKPTTLARISRSSNVVFYNTEHAVYSSFGVYDEAKDADGLANIWKFRFKRAYWKCGKLFCGPCGAFEIE